MDKQPVIEKRFSVCMHTKHPVIWGVADGCPFWWCIETGRFARELPKGEGIELYAGGICLTHGLEGVQQGLVTSYDDAFRWLRGETSPPPPPDTEVN